MRCSSCAVCAGVGYTRGCDSTSVHLCAFSLQNLAVSPDFCALLGVSVTPTPVCLTLSDPVFDGVGLAGFKSRANAFLLA